MELVTQQLYGIPCVKRPETKNPNTLMEEFTWKDSPKYIDFTTLFVEGYHKAFRLVELLKMQDWLRHLEQLWQEQKTK